MYPIRRHLCGYLVCQYEGSQFYRFMNICKKRKIYLWKIRTKDLKTNYCVLSEALEEHKEAAKKCGGHIEIIKRCGLPFVIKKNIRHRYFFIGLLLAVICIYSMSRYIWNVEITGNYRYSQGTIVECLNELNAGCGAKKGQIVPSKIEEELRLRYPGIAWVSVQIIGTKLLINMEEGVQWTEEVSENKSSIKADMDGTVVSIVTRKGTPMVHQGDTVKKGDVLINGYTEILGDDLTVAKTIETGADGDVIMEYEIPVKETIKRDYNEKVYTGQEKTSRVISLFQHEFNLGPEENPYELADQVKGSKYYRLTTFLYLPLYSEKTVYKEYRLEPAIYTDQELELLGENYLNGKIQTYINAGAIVDCSQVVKAIDKEGCKLTGKLIVTIAAGQLP